MARVSVVIPTFNCAQYIVAAVESALGQTYKDIEIIVVDDGSKDNTHEIIKAYENAGLIKYIFQENKGLPGARNTGILKSTGEFLAFLDADDELDRRMVSMCLERIEKEDTEWCLIDILRIENTGSEIKEEVQRCNIPENNLDTQILADDFIRRAPFFRKKSLFEIGLYDEDMRIREDYDINIRMILAGKRFSYIPEPLYIYKIRSNSLVKTKYKKKYDYALKLLKKHSKKIADDGNKDVARVYAHNLWRLGRNYLTDVHDIKSFIFCVGESLKYDFSLWRLAHPFYFHLIKSLSVPAKNNRQK
jgi:glycosyltransferase involved in cell wall biosynthesis